MADIEREWHPPGQPTHPDFWRICDCVVEADAEATESEDGFQRVIGAIVDLTTLNYVAHQRTLRLQTQARAPMSSEHWWMMASTLWLDGFIAGAKYQQRGGHRE